LTQVPLSAFSEKTVVKLKDYTFYVNKVDRKNNLLEGVSIYKFSDSAEKTDKKKTQAKQDENISWRISAASATVKIYRGGVGLNLYGGFWQKAGSDNLKNIIHMTFNSYRFYISLFDQMENLESSIQEENSFQILKKISALKKENKPYGNYAVEFWTRLLFATAPIAFALLAVPLGIMSGKGGKAIGFGISIFVIVLYYMLLISAMHISEKNYSYAGFIMWFPNIFISLCGTILFAKMVKR
jgi:lipopolysaccharide export system permease protein